MNSEIVVIGGGPAGATCARQLARLGHRVVLADGRAGVRARLGESAGPGLARLLRDACGLTVPPSVASPLDSLCSAWGGSGVERRSYSFWRAADGLVLDRAAFDGWLLGAAESSGVTVLRGCRVAAATRAGGRWRLTAVADGRACELSASHVVEATGRAAPSVTQPDNRRVTTDALVCVASELPAQATADPGLLVEACRDGWWYTVVTPGGRRVVALFTDADLVGPARRRPAWFSARLGETAHVVQVAVAPSTGTSLRICGARTSIRSVLWRDRYLAIGDAACFLDPLSGTGIERSVEDGVRAAEALSRAVCGDNPGELREQALRKARTFRDGLAMQRGYYGAVARWADEPFWRRRKPAAASTPRRVGRVKMGCLEVSTGTCAE